MNYIHLIPYVISALYFGTFTSWFGMLDPRYEEYNEDRDMYKHLPAVYLRICMLDIRLQVEVKDQNIVKHPLGIYHRKYTT